MSEGSESIMRGLQEMFDHAQGKIELRSHYMTAIPPKEYTPVEIREIRVRLNMSQGFFAEIIGVSKKTIESWEYGRGKPNGAAARMLTIVDMDPDALQRYGFVKW